MADETVKVVIKGEDQATPAMRSVGGSLRNLGKIAKTLAVGAAAGIGAAGFAIGKLAMDAAAIEPIRESFQNLTASIGESAQAVVQSMRAASMGTMRDAELMRAANKLIAMGLAESAEEAGNLSEMAVTLGVAMGEEAGPALENFTLMMANQSIPRLDTFGISSGKVRERILELMAATEDMTREEAFKIAVMEQGAIAMGKVGDVSKTSAVTMAQLRTILGNLKDTVGTALLPVLAAVLGPLRDLAVTYGPMVQEWAEGFSGWLTTEGIPSTIQFGQNVVKWIGGAMRAIAPYMEIGRRILVQIGEALRFVQYIMAAGLENAFYRLQEAIEDVAPQWVVGAIGSIGEAIGWLKDVVPGGVEAIMQFGQQAQQWIQGVALPAVMQFASVAIPVLVGFGQQVYQIFTGQVIPTVQQMVTWFRDNIPQAIATMVGVWGTISAAVAPAVASLVGAVLPAFQEIVGVIRNEAGPTLEVLRGLWEALQPTLSAVAVVVGGVLAVAFTTLVGVIQGLVQGAAGGFQGFVMVIQGAIQVVTGILQVFTGFVQLIVGLIRGDTEQMTMAWEMMKVGVIGIVQGLGTAIEGAFRATFGFVLGFLEGFVSGFLKTLGGLLKAVLGQKPDWIDAGEELIKGLIEGIKAMAEAAVEAAKGVVSSAIAAAKSLLGIGSPSKVMAQMGGQMMEGLMAGLEGVIPTAQVAMTVAGGGMGAMQQKVMIVAPVMVQGDRYTTPGGQMDYRSLGDLILSVNERLR